MLIKDKIFKRFAEKQKKKILLNEQSAKLTVKKTEHNTQSKLIQVNGTLQEEYPIVEREICPAKIICPDCGGETLEGLDYCDKCGGELNF